MMILTATSIGMTLGLVIQSAVYAERAVGANKLISGGMKKKKGTWVQDSTVQNGGVPPAPGQGTKTSDTTGPVEINTDR